MSKSTIEFDHEMSPWAADFFVHLDAKLAEGAKRYPDSLTRDPLELLEEWQQEAIDIAGWGYVLWQRMEKLKEDIIARQGR